MDAGRAGPTDSGTDAAVRTHTGVWRVMPLGDSITGEMCPPQLLSQGSSRTGTPTSFSSAAT